MSRRVAKLLLILGTLLGTAPAYSTLENTKPSSEKCEIPVAGHSKPTPEKRVTGEEQLQEIYKKTNELQRKLRPLTKNLLSPLQRAGIDPVEVGRVQHTFNSAFPGFFEFHQKSRERQEGDWKAFLEEAGKVMNYVENVLAQGQNDPNQVFSAIELLRLTQIRLAHVEIPA